MARDKAKDGAEVASVAEGGDPVYLTVTVDRGQRRRLWREVIGNHAGNMWVIPLVTQGSQIGVLSDDFGNVPERAISSWVTMTPGYLSPETFFSRSAAAER